MPRTWALLTEVGTLKVFRQFGALIPHPVAPRAPWPSVVDAVAASSFVEVIHSAEVFWLERDAKSAGEVHASPLSQASALKPHELDPCRLPNKHVGMPNYVGWLPMPSASGPRSVVTESLNERWHYLDLAIAGAATDFCAQPLMIKWSFNNGVRVHFPDAFMETADGQRVLIDVTRRSKLEDPAALAIFLLTAASAAIAGWDYQLRVELPAQRVTNLRFLTASFWAHLDDAHAVLSQQLSEPVSVQLASQAFGGGPEALAVVWKLLAQGWLHTDLCQAISPVSQLTVHPPTQETPWLIKI